MSEEMVKTYNQIVDGSFSKAKPVITQIIKDKLSAKLSDKGLTKIGK